MSKCEITITVEVVDDDSYKTTVDVDDDFTPAVAIAAILHMADVLAQYAELSTRELLLKLVKLVDDETITDA